MKLFLILVVAVLKTSAQTPNPMTPLPLLDCTPRVVSPDLTIKSASINVTFLDGPNNKAFGPANCGYAYKIQVTPKKSLDGYKFYGKVNGKDAHPPSDFCKGENGVKVQPECCGAVHDGLEINLVNPAGDFSFLGDITYTFGFMKDGKVVSCNRLFGRLFKSSCCV